MNKLERAHDTLRQLKNKPSLSSRQKAELAHAQRVIRRRTMKLLGWGAAALTIAGAGMTLKCPKEEYVHVVKNPDEHNHPEPAKSSGDLPEQIEWQNTQKENTTRALAIFQNALPETKKLFEMFQKHAFFSLPLNTVATRRMFTPGASLEEIMAGLSEASREFEVVFMPEIYAKTMPARIIWDWQGKTLRITTDNTFDEWFSIFLYHELSHVFDLLFEGNDPAQPAQWLLGEVKAHELECRLIHHWKPEAYRRLIKDGVPSWEKKDKDAVIDLGSELFPSTASSKSTSTMFGGFTTCVAFESGRQRGIDLREVYAKELFPQRTSPR